MFSVVSLLLRRDKFAKSQDVFTPRDHLKNIRFARAEFCKIVSRIFDKNTKLQQARCDHWRGDRDEARRKWRAKPRYMRSEWLLIQTTHWISTRECLISRNSQLRPQRCSGDIKENCGMLMSGSSTTPCSIWQGTPACCINHCPVVSFGHLTQEGTHRSNSTV